MSNRPVIGVTSYVEPASWGHWHDVPAALVPHAYVRHIDAAGGIAVTIPPLPFEATEADADAVVDRLDGLVIAGGVDIEPQRYGEAPHPLTQPSRPDRDQSEILLAHATARSGLPVLGVCRGMQVLAVAAGGRLDQHLPDVVGGAHHAPEVGRYGVHHVRLDPESRLGAILGDEVTVSTYHHQGVAEAPGYVCTAWAEDDIVEGIEDPDAAFRIGVQWHPEAGDDPRLFLALVEAARDRS